MILALTLSVLIGFAAIAIDLALGFNERRQDQTAADIGVMAGAVDTLASNATIRDQILDFTRRNVTASYTNASWQALWEGCTDPERADLNASGFSFVPVVAPTGWSVGTLDCISIDGGGFVRVNLPELEFSTTFGRIIGINELRTSADAIARIVSRGGGGILPFGLPIRPCQSNFVAEAPPESIPSRRSCSAKQPVDPSRAHRPCDRGHSSLSRWPFPA